MNKNCQLFYKRLRILFPSVGFSEGKFLRDIKMQLRDFSMENPGAEYEDVVEFFGNPEDVYVNYIQSRVREEIYQKFKARKVVKYCIVSIIIFLILIWGMVFLVWLKGYRNFNYIVPTMKETIINEGEVRYEEN